MAPLGYKFRAVRPILVNGALAYNPGDLVHEDAVTGPDATLAVGDDVEPVAGAVLDAPAKNASQAAWAAYAVSRGADRDAAAGMSRAELVNAFGPQP